LADARLTVWETLFRRTLELIDSVADAGITIEHWTFGGGTVLMRRYQHRLSKDVDIFLPDPQYLAYLTPRLNTKAESLTDRYVEQHGFLKLFFPEGEIDFVVAGPLTKPPTTLENVLGREVSVETSVEIVAKKVWYRGAEFTARDIFDLALVAEKEAEAL
jgi:Nucleotidyl transferase AbiEii toxin, Type IV TA system